MPPRNFVSSHGVSRVRVNFIKNDHQMATGTSIAERNRASRRPANIRVQHAVQYVFDFFLSNAVLRTMLDISVGIIVQVPDKTQSHRTERGSRHAVASRE